MRLSAALFVLTALACNGLTHVESAQASSSLRGRHSQARRHLIERSEEIPGKGKGSSDAGKGGTGKGASTGKGGTGKGISTPAPPTPTSTPKPPTPGKGGTGKGTEGKGTGKGMSMGKGTDGKGTGKGGTGKGTDGKGTGKGGTGKGKGIGKGKGGQGKGISTPVPPTPTSTPAPPTPTSTPMEESAEMKQDTGSRQFFPRKRPQNGAAIVIEEEDETSEVESDKFVPLTGEIIIEEEDDDVGKTSEPVETDLFGILKENQEAQAPAKTAASPTAAEVFSRTEPETEAETEAETESEPEDVKPLTTSSPTAKPTSGPTKRPTASPTTSPTLKPTDGPTTKPTNSPTALPTAKPADGPTVKPTKSPTALPTAKPTDGPTAKPTDGPTARPTKTPTDSPTAKPTDGPTAKPTSASPTISPTRRPTLFPTSSPTETCAGDGVRAQMCGAKNKNRPMSCCQGHVCSKKRDEYTCVVGTDEDVVNSIADKMKPRTPTSSPTPRPPTSSPTTASPTGFCAGIDVRAQGCGAKNNNRPESCCPGLVCSRKNNDFTCQKPKDGQVVPEGEDKPVAIEENEKGNNEDENDKPLTALLDLVENSPTKAPVAPPTKEPTFKPTRSPTKPPSRMGRLDICASNNDRAVECGADNEDRPHSCCPGFTCAPNVQGKMYRCMPAPPSQAATEKPQNTFISTGPVRTGGEVPDIPILGNPENIVLPSAVEEIAPEPVAEAPSVPSLAKPAEPQKVESTPKTPATEKTAVEKASSEDGTCGIEIETKCYIERDPISPDAWAVSQKPIQVDCQTITETSMKAGEKMDVTWSYTLRNTCESEWSVVARQQLQSCELCLTTGLQCEQDDSIFAPSPDNCAILDNTGRYLGFPPGCAVTESFAEQVTVGSETNGRCMYTKEINLRIVDGDKTVPSNLKYSFVAPLPMP